MKKTQENYLQLQMIEAQLQQGEKELAAIDAKYMEITALRESLKELKSVKKGFKMFSPMGFGIYAPGNVGDAKQLLVNVGAGVVVKKSIEDVRNVLENQIKQFKEITNNIMQNMQMMAMQAQALERELAQK